MDSWDKFDETKLSLREKFYSELTGSGIAENDWEHVKKVWNEFNLSNLRDYHDLYLKTDVILLANVFEEFRSTCMRHYGLDPVNFYTSPGLACLKKTGIKLELLTDPDMLMIFEKGIRGGIAQVVHRYTKSNNKYMSNSDSKMESSYIQYLNVNNLYGWAMSEPLPPGGFKWVDVKPEEGYELSKKENYGYILKVDVRYPKEIHDSHNDLPFMCEKMKIDGVEKLTPNLYDKWKYLIHIRALIQVLDHGLILEKVHRAIEFEQSAWMKPYIDFNIQLRTQATNDFEKSSSN